MQLDVRPFPFQLPFHGETPDERVRFAEIVERNLVGKGLIVGREFAPEFSRLLGIFATGQLSIAMLGTAGDQKFIARASTDGRNGVLAVRHDEMVRFDPISPEALVRSVVRLLPPLKAGLGSSLSITVDVGPKPPRRRYDEDDDFYQSGVLEQSRASRTSSATQEAAIAEIMRRPRLGSGYFTVTVRGRNGQESEPLTVSWLDTDAGRYAVIPSKGADGQLHGAFTPADQGRIDQVLTRHVESLR